MTNEELKLKVINAAAKVEKKKAIVQKHQDRLRKLVEKNSDAYDIRIKRDEIKEATKKLEESKQVLANWQAKLDEKISEDAYLEANAPDTIKIFLDCWKKEAVLYYMDRFVRYIKKRKELRQQELDARREALETLPELERARQLYKDREVGDYELHNLFPRKPVEDFLKAKGLDYYQIQKKLATDGMISRMLDIRDPNERALWLDNEMEKEKRAKLLDLTNRIMKVVGRITDASGLYIANNGEINGYIEGTEGRAKVETIGAGGYNIQRFHFRTLIHECK